tara:strand:- start:136908 stop:138332 length:1425 start_codon:yes stop_codon:yes gene_type:complete
MDLSIVVLAAGQGTRMMSPLPKVLHPIGGKPMLEHVLKAAQTLNPSQIIIIHGYEGELVKQHFKSFPLTWVEQTERLGTGDAVSKALPHIPDDHRVLTLYGDVPLIAPDTLKRLLAAAPENSIGLLTAIASDPTGLGRIVREDRRVMRIVEENDANDIEKQIHEVNTGIFVVGKQNLERWVPLIENTNAKGEYYLTDIIQMAAEEGCDIVTAVPSVVEEVLGVNDKSQQVTAERYYQRHLAEALLKKGVCIFDPARFDLRGSLEADIDVVIDVNVVIEGKVTMKKNTRIGPNCVLINCELGENVSILANSYLEDVIVGDNCSVGPFARLRPGTELSSDVHIGNFVEIKNTIIGKGSKVSHLSYIGDAVMGKTVNIGAGTITCNYDGANKYRTIIGDNAFIGSDTQLIAPVKVGEGATIAAGSTLTKDAPAHQLTMTHKLLHRSEDGWARPVKQKGGTSKKTTNFTYSSEEVKSK